MQYLKAEYIETASGNKVSRKSVLCGTKNIRVKGKSVVMPGAVVRGDLAKVAIGRYTIVRENSVLRPPCKRYKGGIAFFPLTIGDHVTIEAEAIVQALSIGSFVHIGKGAVIGARTVIHPCSRVEEGAVVPPDSVIAPFSIWKGFPARPLAQQVGELPALPVESFSKRPRPPAPLYGAAVDGRLLDGATELPECWEELQTLATREFYDHFVAKPA